MVLPFVKAGIVHLNQLPHTYQKTNRVWVEVEVEDYGIYKRPLSQGVHLILAQRMKIIRELDII
jgi:hypothetical protein